jgi:hypothetical protein
MMLFRALVSRLLALQKYLVRGLLAGSLKESIDAVRSRRGAMIRAPWR